MKKLIAFLLLIPLLADAAGNNMKLLQRRADDSGEDYRLLATPAGGADGIMYYDGTISRPGYLTYGTGLSVSGGVLSATAAAQVQTDWNATTGLGVLLHKPTALSAFTNDVGFALSTSLATVATSGTFSSLMSKPTTLSGYGITDAYPLTGNPSSFLTGITSAQVTGYIPAALYAKIRTQNNTGTPTFTARPGQEVLF